MTPRALSSLEGHGVSGFVWMFVASTLSVFHATMLINSLGHLWGSGTLCNH